MTEAFHIYSIDILVSLLFVVAVVAVELIKSRGKSNSDDFFSPAVV